MAIEVTVRDTENGERGVCTIEDDYVLITAGRRYLDGIVRYANGTVQLTIKVRRDEPGVTS